MGQYGVDKGNGLIHELFVGDSCTSISLLSTTGHSIFRSVTKSDYLKTFSSTTRLSTTIPFRASPVSLQLVFLGTSGKPKGEAVVGQLFFSLSVCILCSFLGAIFIFSHTRHRAYRADHHSPTFKVRCIKTSCSCWNCVTTAEYYLSPYFLRSSWSRDETFVSLVPCRSFPQL